MIKHSLAFRRFLTLCPVYIPTLNSPRRIAYVSVTQLPKLQGAPMGGGVLFVLWGGKLFA
jgi:hypothetical protein